MVAGETTDHPEHTMNLTTDSGDCLLKSGVVYGANASGKSNLVRALKFAKEFVLSRPKPDEIIRVIPFYLDIDSHKSPSTFEFELQTETGAYIYRFEVNANSVLSEKLSLVDLENVVEIFSRKGFEAHRQVVNLGAVRDASPRDVKILKSTSDALRPNELYLSKIVDNNVAFLKDVHDWFRDTLNVVLSDELSSFVTSSYLTHSEYEQNVQDLIGLFDVGIDAIELRDLSVDPSADEITGFRSQFEDRNRDMALFFPSDALALFLPAGRPARTAQLVATHFIRNKNLKVNFNLTQESDGTRRLLALSWALIALLTGDGDQVLVIDELELRLHPLMTRNILEIFHANAGERRCQLIATTHESGLLDLDLLRRDEIWFIEKNIDGASDIYSLEEFVPSYDRDISTGYLQGRFGAIPIVPSYNILDWATR